MRRLFVAAIAMVVAVAFTPVNASAVKVSDSLKVGFQGQFHMSLSEDAQYAPAGGEDKAFGFKVKRLRYSIAYKAKGIFAKFNIETAGSSLGLKDGFFGIKMGGTKIIIGQMRPAASQEAGMQSSKKLKNIYRADMRSTTSGFYAANNSFRDLGIFVQHSFSKAAKLHVSITNGLGAVGGARDVGGATSKGYATANAVGDVAIVGALVLNMKPARVTLHYGMNKHDNAVVGKDAIVDLDRTIYGASVLVKAGMIIFDAEYSMLENNDSDSKVETSGYYGRVSLKLSKATLIAVRYQQVDKAGHETTAITATLNQKLTKGFTIQLEGDQHSPDGGDDVTTVMAAFLAAI